jgi:hypothetical protein
VIERIWDIDPLRTDPLFGKTETERLGKNYENVSVEVSTKLKEGGRGQAQANGQAMNLSTKDNPLRLCKFDEDQRICMLSKHDDRCRQGQQAELGRAREAWSRSRNLHPGTLKKKRRNAFLVCCCCLCLIKKLDSLYDVEPDGVGVSICIVFYFLKLRSKNYSVGSSKV